MQVIKWPKVYLPATMLRRRTEPLPREPVRYRAKVKLHGTNSAIHLPGDGFRIQSRRRVIRPDSDNYGFAKWASMGIAEKLAERARLLELPPTTIGVRPRDG